MICSWTAAARVLLLRGADPRPGTCAHAPQEAAALPLKFHSFRATLTRMMPKAATAPKANRSVQRELARELLELRIEHADIFSKMDSLKASLIDLATDAGDGFREIFLDKGQVTVAAAKSKQFTGHKPEIDVKLFDALSEMKRQKLIDAGIVKIVAHYSREFHGSCTVKTF